MSYIIESRFVKKGRRFGNDRVCPLTSSWRASSTSSEFLALERLDLRRNVVGRGANDSQIERDTSRQVRIRR